MSPGKSYGTMNIRIPIRKKTHLWLIAAKLSVAVCETLDIDLKLDIAAAHDILNLEFRKIGVKAKLLDNARVLARCQARITFALRTSNDHLSRRENQCGCFGVANPHMTAAKRYAEKK